MALQLSFPPAWVTSDADERAQRRALAWHIGCVRWLCVVFGLAWNRAPLCVAIYAGVALYNSVPFCFAPRFTARQLRVFGWAILALDSIMLLFISLLMAQRRDYPIPMLLLIFEASLRAGFEPPRPARIGMAVTTIAVAACGFADVFYGDPWRDALLWTMLCAFLGVRGTMIAQRRWRIRQQRWATLGNAPMPLDAPVASSVPTESSADTPPNPLTKRECDVLTLAARGLSNKEIAAALCISERTVNTHMEHINRKLGANSRCRSVAIAVGYQWIEPPPLAAPDQVASG